MTDELPADPLDYELWSFHTVRREGEPPSHVFQGLRDATPDEVRVTTGSEREVLSWIAYNSMISEIGHAVQEFERSVDELGAMLRSPNDATLGFPRVQHRFGGVPLAARAYVDRTGRWLKHQFGPGSDELSAFKTSCSFEYDNVFAYRLGYELRNVVSHAGDAINISRVSSSADLYGPTRAELTLAIDGPGLASEYTRMKAQVRDELRALTKPISAAELVDLQATSIARIHCKTLKTLSDHMDSLRSVLEAAQREAEDACGPDAVKSDDPNQLDAAAMLVEKGTADKLSATRNGFLPHIQMPVHLLRTAMHYLSDNDDILQECNAILTNVDSLFDVEPHVFEAREPGLPDN